MKKVYLSLVLILGCVLGINGKSLDSNVGDDSMISLYTTSARA